MGGDERCAERTLPPPLLRARLHSRLASPTGAARDLPARQQTIPATIDWSIDLVGSAEQLLFARLGSSRALSPWRPSSRVCADPGSDVVDVLSHLVDQSLVHRSRGRMVRRVSCCLSWLLRTPRKPGVCWRIRGIGRARNAAATRSPTSQRCGPNGVWISRPQAEGPRCRAGLRHRRCRCRWCTGRCRGGLCGLPAVG